MISYAPLWRTLEEKGVTQYQLINQYGVRTGTLHPLRKHRSATLNTIQDLCLILRCPIEKIVEIKM